LWYSFLQGRSYKCAYHVIATIAVTSSYTSNMKQMMIQYDCLIVRYTKKGYEYGFQFSFATLSPRRCASTDGMMCQFIQPPTAESRERNLQMCFPNRLQKCAVYFTAVRQIMWEPQPPTEHLVEDLG